MLTTKREIKLEFTAAMLRSGLKTPSVGHPLFPEPGAAQIIGNALLFRGRYPANADRHPGTATQTTHCTAGGKSGRRCNLSCFRCSTRNDRKDRRDHPKHTPNLGMAGLLFADDLADLTQHCAWAEN
jgi:hypothetical protein